MELQNTTQKIDIESGAAQAVPTSTDGLWRYGVRVHGIKRRARKVQWHSDSSEGLGETQELDRDLAVTLAKRWIDANIKSYDKAFAMVHYWTFDPVTKMETWRPFTESHNISIPL